MDSYKKSILFSFLIFFFCFQAEDSQAVLNYLTPNNPWTVDGTVSAIKKGPDGTIYVGGAFYSLFNTNSSTHSMALPINTVTNLPGMATYPSLNSSPEMVIPDGNNGWYIGGGNGGALYIQGDPEPRYLIHVLSTGVINPSFNPVITSTVRALALSSTTLYIGGDFRFVNNTARNRLAALDTSGNLLSWNPDVNNGVYDIALDPSGSTTTIYVGGAFTTSSAAVRNRAAAFDANGAVSSWNPNVGSGIVYRILLHPSGATSTIYMSGSFTSVGSSTKSYLASVNNTNGATTTWSPIPNSSVFSGFTMSSTTLYVGGSFTTITNNGVTSNRNRLAAFDLNGNLLDTWVPGKAAGVNYMLYASGTIYMSNGSGTTVNPHSSLVSTTVGPIVGFDEAGEISFNPVATLGYNQTAGRSLAYANNVVYLMGWLRGFYPVGREFIFALDSNRNLKSWYPSLNGSVSTMLVTSNTVYVAGSFTTVTGTNSSGARERLAAFDFDGNLLPWAPRVNGSVNALAINPEGTVIYAGGAFTTTSDSNRQRLAAFDLNGNTLAWDPGASSTVNTIVVGPSGITTSIFVGGSFTKVANTTRNRIAAIDPNGVLIGSWNPAMGSTVNTLEFDQTGSTSSIFVGGSFTTVSSSVARNRAAAIDMNGKATQWNPNITGTVSDIEITTTSVYLVGSITSVSGTARTGFVELDKTSGTIKGYDLNIGGSTSAAVSLITENSFFVGASFFNSYFGYDRKMRGPFGEFELHRAGFVSSASTVAENVGTVTFVYTLNATSTEDISFDYAVSGGTATQGNDFTFSTGTATITAGSLTTSVDLIVTDDVEADPNETIVLTLSNSRGAAITTSTYTLTISDDDVASSGSNNSSNAYSPPLVMSDIAATAPQITVTTTVSTTTTVIMVTTTLASPTTTIIIIPILVDSSHSVATTSNKTINATPLFKRQLMVGTIGDDVLQLQKMLNKLGFTVAKTGAGSPGNETKTFGPATKKAVIQFQEKNRATILVPLKLRKGTGAVGAATLRALNVL